MSGGCATNSVKQEAALKQFAASDIEFPGLRI
jgi:hypothetical protein